MLRYTTAYCSVNGCADDALAVIVIDFDDVEFLKEHKVVSYEPFDVALHFGLQVGGVEKSSFFIGETRVLEGKPLDKVSKTA